MSKKYRQRAKCLLIGHDWQRYYLTYGEARFRCYRCDMYKVELDLGRKIFYREGSDPADAGQRP